MYPLGGPSKCAFDPHNRFVTEMPKLRKHLHFVELLFILILVQSGNRRALYFGAGFSPWNCWPIRHEVANRAERKSPQRIVYGAHDRVVAETVFCVLER
jgi:hypothetical protein